jgi:hypothetical protein
MKNGWSCHYVNLLIIPFRLNASDQAACKGASNGVWELDIDTDFIRFCCGNAASVRSVAPARHGSC